MFNRHGTEFIHDKVRFVSGEHWKIWRCDVESSLLCYLWLGLRTEYYASVPSVIYCPVHSISSWSRIIVSCIIEVEDFIYSCITWDFADWCWVVISFDRRVWPSSKHYTPASLWILYFHVHLSERLKFASRIEISSNIGSELRPIRIPDPWVIPPSSTSRPKL